MEIQFPSFEGLPDFDPDDPFDGRAEAIRKRVVEAFTSGDFAITPENAEATLAGMMVAVMGVAMCATKPEGHRDLVAAVQAYAPWAANKAREIMGMELLKDN